MRQFVFKSTYIKEVGYYQNGAQVCNTSLGIFKAVAQTTEPQLRTGRRYEVWIDTPSDLFDKAYPVYIIKFGNYHVALDPLDVMTFEAPSFKWQWVYRDQEQLVPLFGTPKLFLDNVNKAQSIDSMAVIECDADIELCIATEGVLHKQFSLITIALIILGFVLSCMMFFWLGRILIEHYYSPELRIKRGLKNKSFYPLFQPIVALKSGEIIGCEVLARFRDDLGYMAPQEFIPLVSKLGITVPFTRGMFKSGMSALLKQHDLPTNFKVNFNVFPNDLTSTNVARLAEHKELFTSRFQMCFEITEDEPFRSQTAQEALCKLKELGAQVAIDDFGTGYSNLTQLQSIPFDYLKVDKSFCVGLERSTFRASLIPQIAKIADSLDVPIVAEGVETQAQRIILIKEKIKFAQGFLFSHPVTAVVLNQLVTAQIDV